MTRLILPAATLAAILGACPAPAQYDLPLSRPPAPTADDDPKPVYKYELTPETGEYLVSVKTFRGSTPGDRQVKELAEGLADYIRTECRLYAYIHETGWALRRERTKEKDEYLKKKRRDFEARGIKPTPEMLKVKMVRIPDEYTVLVAPGKGTLKNLEEALAFAKYVRQLKAPPDEFCDAVVIGTTKDIASRKGDPVNPFLTVFAGRNPTLPKKITGALQVPKADDFLMNLNSGHSYSLIHKTRKKWTLVVQMYGNKNAQVVKPGEPTLRTDASNGEMLERAAQQAELVARILRGMKQPYDAYVLHTRYESFVCVGEYDESDDPQLLANVKALSGFSLKDQKTMEPLDTFMDRPLPAMIPRP